MFNKANVFIFYLFFNLHLMLNVFSLNEFFDKNDVDINKFLWFFFASIKKNFNFSNRTISQLFSNSST